MNQQTGLRMKFDCIKSLSNENLISSIPIQLYFVIVWLLKGTDMKELLEIIIKLTSGLN